MNYRLLTYRIVLLLLSTCLLSIEVSSTQQGSSYFFYQQPQYPRDCKEARDQCSFDDLSHVYTIKPDGYPQPFEVYCEDDALSGGWTVIQRQIDGSLTLRRSWEDYKNGFGFLSSEFWIGNEKLSHLTNQAVYELRIDIILTNGSSFYLSYNSFRISDEWSDYTIVSAEGFRSNLSCIVSLCPLNMTSDNCTCQNLCTDPIGQTDCYTECAETCVLEGCFVTETNSFICVMDTRLVSFPAPYGGYVQLNLLDFYNIGTMVMNFKAHRSSGLIAYLADNLHEDIMAVQLVDGRVEAIFGKEANNITQVKSNEDTYDDGMWHSVNISKITSREVGLIIDDVDDARANFRTRTSEIKDGVMFIGGLPSSLPYNKIAIPDLQPFVGCVADFSVGAGVQNFALRLTDLNASYNFCPDEAENVTQYPAEPPLISQSPTEPPVIPTTRAVTPTVAPEECKLGLLGSAAADPLDAGAGFFGATNESRYDFESLGREYVTEDEMYFGLKTAAEYGVLYYTADANQYDFTSLYLEDGYLVYTFDYGSGAVVIQSNARINDNQWHEVRTTRENSLGVIFVDGQRVGQGHLTGSSLYLSVETPIYVGGLPSDLEVNDVPLRSRVSLIGCIKDFTVDPPRAKLSEVEVDQCQGLREPGVFFGQLDGYLILDETFNIGVSIEISLEINPRKTTGIIFSVQKPNMDFMSLELRAGELFLTVENGGGEFTATFSTADADVSLCDGEWHQIIVSKDRYVASLTVDGVQGVDGQSSNTSQSDASTNDPLYFGGLPTNVVHDGIIENEHYVGCIRNVAVNGEFKSLTSSKTSGDVDVRSCPAN